MSKLTDKIEALEGTLHSAREWTHVTINDLNGFSTRLASILADVQELERTAEMLQTETNALLDQIEARGMERYTQVDVDVLVGTAREQGKTATRVAKREAYKHALSFADYPEAGFVARHIREAIDALEEEGQ